MLPLVIGLDVRVSIVVRVVLSGHVVMLLLVLVEVVGFVRTFLGSGMLLGVVVGLLRSLVMMLFLGMMVRFVAVLFFLMRVLLALMESVWMANSEFLQVSRWVLGLSLPISFI